MSPRFLASPAPQGQRLTALPEKYKDPNYTQMSLFSNLVWKDTTKIGCAWVWGCTDNNAEWGYILLCES